MANNLQLVYKKIETEGIDVLKKNTDLFHCAGVIPYCLWGSSVYFILGKSRSNKLLSFTGKSEHCRNSGVPCTMFESPCMTAARELYEESLGSILKYEQCVEATRACDLNHVMIGLSPKGTVVYSFLVEVPFRKHYTTCFAKIRTFLNFIDVREHYLNEFSELKVVCAETMNTKIKQNWRSSGMLTTEQEWQKIERLAAASSHLPLPPGLAQQQGAAASASSAHSWRTREAAPAEADNEDNSDDDDDSNTPSSSPAGSDADAYA
jgi:hypothetical protein